MSWCATPKSTRCCTSNNTRAGNTATSNRCWSAKVFFFQAEDGIRDFDCDWSSDVCSSDLVAAEQEWLAGLAQNSGDSGAKWAQLTNRVRVVMTETVSIEEMLTETAAHLSNGERLKSLRKIGRASCRERV